MREFHCVFHCTTCIRVIVCGKELTQRDPYARIGEVRGCRKKLSSCATSQHIEIVYGPSFDTSQIENLLGKVQDQARHHCTQSKDSILVDQDLRVLHGGSECDSDHPLHADGI